MMTTREYRVVHKPRKTHIALSAPSPMIRHTYCGLEVLEWYAVTLPADATDGIRCKGCMRAILRRAKQALLNPVEEKFECDNCRDEGVVYDEDGISHSCPCNTRLRRVGCFWTLT